MKKKLKRTKSGHPVMPFGKHEGKPFPGLPFRYLVWLAHNISAEGEWKEVRFAAWDELKRRKKKRDLREDWQETKARLDREYGPVGGSERP